MHGATGAGAGWRTVLLAAVATAVAVAFADSSIVVLALPELYGGFETTIEGVAWVITSYNLVLAVFAILLVPLVRRTKPGLTLAMGSVVFLGASVACALSGSLAALIAARSVQGLGGALLLAGSVSVLGTLAGSTVRGIAIWVAAGTFGTAVGPALGGLLTQAFDWRAIFVAQAPVAGLALLAAAGSHVAVRPEGPGHRLRRGLPANLALALVSGALVGTLFLGVLLVIEVFGYAPIQGATIVSLIPATALLARPLASGLPAALAVGSGAVLLAAGLVGLALLPSSALGFALASFALCGFGLGLAVPGLSHSALAGARSEEILGGSEREATFTVGIRHLGLVLALAVVAPIVAEDLRTAERVATLNATAVVIDGQIPATTKIPLALEIRDALRSTPEGEVPDLSAPFEEHGVSSEPSLQQVRDEMVASIEEAITRGFRRAFAFCALLALLALVPVLIFRRRLVA